MKNVRVTDEFARLGGTELGPMSTTDAFGVAVDYSRCANAKSLIFKIVTENKLQRGAGLTREHRPLHRESAMNRPRIGDESAMNRRDSAIDQPRPGASLLREQRSLAVRRGATSGAHAGAHTAATPSTADRHEKNAKNP